MRAVKMTEEKVRKLLPIVESILSREYGRKVTLKDLTVGGITVYKKKIAPNSAVMSHFVQAFVSM